MTNNLETTIVKFIKSHHVLNLATSYNNEPYAASCFYMYLESKNQLIFASDEHTKHIQDCLYQPIVAGTIVLETKLIHRIKGIQFKGTFHEVTDDTIKRKYIKRFPPALFISFKLWAIQINFIKMTDNSLGFGEKMVWENF